MIENNSPHASKYLKPTNRNIRTKIYPWVNNKGNKKMSNNVVLVSPLSTLSTTRIPLQCLHRWLQQVDDIGVNWQREEWPSGLKLGIELEDSQLKIHQTSLFGPRWPLGLNWITEWLTIWVIEAAPAIMVQSWLWCSQIIDKK